MKINLNLLLCAMRNVINTRLTNNYIHLFPVEVLADVQHMVSFFYITLL